MERDKISDDVRYVVSGRHIGAIFPTKVMELNREVYLHDGADVTGALYAHSLYVRGGHVSVSRSVVVKNSLKISLETAGLINFKSSLSVGRSLYIENLSEDNYIRVRGDVHLQNANMKNMIVYGNIYGHHIHLENTAVLGGIFATGRVTVQNSLIGTFLAQQAELRKGTTLWLNNGIGVQGLELAEEIRGFSFSLPELFLDLVKGKPADIPFETFGLTPADVRTLSRSFFQQSVSGEEPTPDAGESEPGPDSTPAVASFLSDEMLKGADSIHCLTLSPRHYYTKGAGRIFNANSRCHALLMNAPGIPEKDLEDRLHEFDRAIRQYLEESQK